MIVVVDTNCLLVSLPKRSETRWLYDALLNHTFQFGITTEMLSEYEEIIGSMFAPEVGYNVVQVLVERKNAILTVPYFHWSLIHADPDDRSDGPQQICRLCYCLQRGLPHHRGSSFQSVRRYFLS